MSDSYLEEARVNTILLLQKDVIEHQIEQLEKFRRSWKKGVEPPQDVTDIDILLRRNMPDEYVSLKRSVDNEEVLIMTILDAEGNVSTAASLAELMVLMTRVSRPEHRALCLYILENKLTQNCSIYFVKMAGLKLLRRWLLTAEAGDCVQDIRSILAICKKLPFDLGAVKDSEIGKVIAKLKKYKSAKQDTTLLQEDIKSVIKDWTEKTENRNRLPPLEIVGADAKLSEKDNELISQIAQKMLEIHGPKNVEVAENQSANIPQIAAPEVKAEKEIKVEVEKKVPKEEPVPKVQEMKVEASKPKPVADVKPAASTSKPMITFSSAPPTVDASAVKFSSAISAAEVKPIVAKPAQPVTIIIEDTAKPTAPSTASAPASSAPGALQLPKPMVGPGAGLVMPPRPILPAPGMRPLARPGIPPMTGALPFRGVPRPMSLPGAFGAQPRAEVEVAKVEELSQSTVAFGSEEVKETSSLKSCLKRKASETAEDTPSKKKKKAGIQWAMDESGSVLREIFTYEVDFMKEGSSAQHSSASHKKREKLEHQLEKERQKVTDSMQSTIPWREPLPLQLPIEILDALNVPCESTEKDVQANRIATIMDKKYFDDDFIDPNPAPALDMSFPTNPPPPFNIPWSMAGYNESVVETALPSMSNSMPGDLHSGGYDNGGFYNPTPKSPWVPDAVLNSLPVEAAQMLINDERAAASLMNPDGSVNEERMHLLRTQPYLFNQTISPMNRPMTSNFPPGPGGYPPSIPAPGNYLNPSMPPQYPTQYIPGAPPRPFAPVPAPHQFPGNPVYVPPPSMAPSQSMQPMRKEFPTTKANTPCRFFTRGRECIKGDKCPFSHAMPSDSSMSFVVPPVSVLRPGSSGDDRPMRRGPGGFF